MCDFDSDVLSILENARSVQSWTLGRCQVAVMKYGYEYCSVGRAVLLRKLHCSYWHVGWSKLLSRSTCEFGSDGQASLKYLAYVDLVLTPGCCREVFSRVRKCWQLNHSAQIPWLSQTGLCDDSSWCLGVMRRICSRIFQKVEHK